MLAGKSTKIEWIKPVFANDVLTGKATVTNLVKRNAKNGLVEVTIEAYNQNGELVLTDVTEVIVKCKTEMNEGASSVAVMWRFYLYKKGIFFIKKLYFIFFS